MDNLSSHRSGSNRSKRPARIGKKKSTPAATSEAVAQPAESLNDRMRFLDADGQPVPQLPWDDRGNAITADGVTFFDLAQAAVHFGRSATWLTNFYRATFAAIIDDRDHNDAPHSVSKPCPPWPVGPRELFRFMPACVEWSAWPFGQVIEFTPPAMQKIVLISEFGHAERDELQRLLDFVRAADPRRRG